MKGTLEVCYHNTEGQNSKQLAKISTTDTNKSFHLDFTINGEDYSFGLYKDVFGIAKVNKDGEDEIMFTKILEEDGGDKRDYRNETSPIKEATHKGFEFDIYDINRSEKWRKTKTVKLSDYLDKWSCGGSGGLDLFHSKNGKRLELSTIETYDIFRDPQKYGIQFEDGSTKKKQNYITLETLNTIDLIADREGWYFI